MRRSVSMLILLAGATSLASTQGNPDPHAAAWSRVAEFVTARIETTRWRRFKEVEPSAGRLRFDSSVDGQALRANLSGVDYYRAFTPWSPRALLRRRDW